jgi:hypothetical protein
VSGTSSIRHCYVNNLFVAIVYAIAWTLLDRRDA